MAYATASSQRYAARPSRIPPRRPQPVVEPPRHHRASVYTIARAELEHRIRVPRNYGMTRADVADLIDNFDDRLAAHVEVVKRRRG